VWLDEKEEVLSSPLPAPGQDPSNELREAIRSYVGAHTGLRVVMIYSTIGNIEHVHNIFDKQQLTTIFTITQFM
jgi:hypothetical protein